MKSERATKGIMLVAGVLTFTAIFAAIAPENATRKSFGVDLDGPVAEIMVRNWGVLVALLGAMLIYGAFNPAVRPLVLTVAVVSKTIFIALLLTRGRAYLGHDIGTAVIVDGIEVILLTIILFARPRVVAEPS